MAVKNATKSIMEQFYGTITPDANAGGFSLLPITSKEGAPARAQYLMEFRDVSVKIAKTSGVPYINARLAVVEPDCFENRGFFTMFYIPVPTESTSPEDLKKMNTNTTRTMGQLDIILGEGSAMTALGSFHDVATLGEALRDLAGDLEGERVVVQVGVQVGTDEYPDSKNVVKKYIAVDKWEGEEN